MTKREQIIEIFNRYSSKTKCMDKLISERDWGEVADEILALPDNEKKDYKMMGGWECPRCHKIHSYLDMTCDCPPRTITKTTYDGTI